MRIRVWVQLEPVGMGADNDIHSVEVERELPADIAEETDTFLREASIDEWAEEIYSELSSHGWEYV